MDPAIQIFKRKLTNLSAANPLLWMGRLKADLGLDWIRLDEAGEKRSWNLLSQILGGAKKISICPRHNPRNADENRLSLHLARLQKSRKLVLQERGVDDLYLAFPFVLGQWPDGSWVRTPFLFIPVQIQDGKSDWELLPEIRRAILNPAFLLAYAHHFKRSLDENLFEKELDLETEDATSFLTAFYALLKDSKLDVHFNADLFSGQLEPFGEIRKSDLPSGFQPGQLKLQPHAALGLFSLSDSLLLPDYEYLEKKGVGIEDLMKDRSKYPEVSPARSNQLVLPLEVDGSQEHCLEAIHSGLSLVVQGPPGTGKSQLIANATANAISQGKSVLLVCQKKIALEVVYQRLKELGIGEHLGFWSDFKKDVTSLYQQIARQVELLEETENRNQSLDTVVLERDFKRNHQETEVVLNRLQDWKTALFDHQIAGRSWLDLLDAPILGKKDQTPDLPFSTLKWDLWEPLLNWVEREWDRVEFGATATPTLQNRIPWLNEGPDGGYGQWLSQLDLMSKAIQNSKTHFLNSGLDISKMEVQSWLNNYSRIELPKLPHEEVMESIKAWGFSKSLQSGFLEKLSAELDQLSSIQMEIKSWIDHEVPTRANLEKWQIWWQSHGNGAYQLAISFQAQTLWSPEKKVFLRLVHGLKKRSLGPVQRYLSVGLAYWNLKQNSRLAFSEAIDFNSECQLVTVWQKAIPDLQDWVKLRKSICLGLPIPEPEGWDQLTNLLDLQRTGNELLFEFGIKWDQHYQTREGFNGFLLNPGHWMDELHGSRDIIRLADQALGMLNKAQQDFVLQLLRFSKQIQPPDRNLVEFLGKSWNRYWKDTILKQYPALNYQEDWFKKDISGLQALLEERRALSKSILRLRLEEATHKDILRNRLQNRITYRALYQGVTRKRKRLPLRTLWESFGEEILKLIPCWFATPESVSATWPMEARFDLVIFDEASQCFGEKGIPAAFRARQLLVLGDDQQLPPNQLFSTRWEESAEEELLYSAQDSFLGLSKQFFPQKTLTCHYRSVFPELIAFSNKHFYQDRLEVLPSLESLFAKEKVLVWDWVGGIWKNQENREEAQKIAQMACARFKEGSAETLGVITFNLRQKVCIEEEVDLYARELGVLVPDYFFVKNIENVQGDERDHIWFSVAYGKNDKGAFLRQFGSLSQSGGENRLNVAVSRARKSIRVFASVMPGDLGDSENLPAGSLLLKHYLAYVFEQSQHVKELSDEHIRLGSIRKLVDTIHISGSMTGHLEIHHPKHVFSASSLKELFGLRPLHLIKLGYNVSFEYRW